MRAQAPIREFLEDSQRRLGRRLWRRLGRRLEQLCGHDLASLRPRLVHSSALAPEMVVHAATQRSLFSTKLSCAKSARASSGGYPAKWGCRLRVRRPKDVNDLSSAKESESIYAAVCDHHLISFLLLIYGHRPPAILNLRRLLRRSAIFIS